MEYIKKAQELSATVKNCAKKKNWPLLLIQIVKKLLNGMSEIMSKCRHINKCILGLYEPGWRLIMGCGRKKREKGGGREGKREGFFLAILPPPPSVKILVAISDCGVLDNVICFTTWWYLVVETWVVNKVNILFFLWYILGYCAHITVEHCLHLFLIR